jgi:hypothetical protein
VSQVEESVSTPWTDVRVGFVGRHTRPTGDSKKSVHRAALVVGALDERVP